MWRLAIVLSAIIILVVSSSATIINVPAQYSTIQAGIDASVNGDTVLVAEGQYYERINFLAKAIIVASQHLIDNDTSHIANTIIDGDTLILGVADTGSVVCFVSGEDSSSVIRGFTIQNGIGILDGGVRQGGGIYCANTSSPLISHCIIRRNSNNGIKCHSDNYPIFRSCMVSENEGGGLDAELGRSIVSDTLVLDSCRIFDNYGFGIDMGYYWGSLGEGKSALRNCSIIGNSGSGLRNDRGGTYYNCTINNNGEHGIGALSGYNNNIVDCTIRGNGGIGIFLEEYSTFYAINDTIDGNAAGAISLGEQSNINMNNCIISNHSTQRGAGINCRGGYPPEYIILENCGFINNVAQYGGAIYDTEAYLRVGLFSTSNIEARGCKFINNRATIGGAIYTFRDRNRTFSNCTFSGNVADTGSAIYFNDAYAGHPNPKIDSCIFAFNGQGPAISCISSVTPTLNCTDIFGNPGGNWVGCIAGQSNTNGNFSIDPLFCDTAAQDYHLASNSYCLAANNSCNTLIGALGAGCGPIYRTLHVSISGNDSTGTGLENNPFRTIQRGVDATNSGDTVLVHDGIYTGSGNRDIDLFNKRIWVKSQNGPDLTIIDCQADSVNQHRGFSIRGGGGDTLMTVIDGFTVKNGYSNEGGGVYLDNIIPGMFNLTNSKIIDNVGGGAYFLTDLGVFVSNCYFSNNRNYGLRIIGGVFNSVEQTELLNNYGDGLSVSMAWDIHIYNSSFRGNAGSGCSLNRCSSIDIENCQFIQNVNSGLSAYSEDQSYNHTLRNCTFIENSNSAINMNSSGSSGSMQIDDCSFSGNMSGALYLHLDFVRCIFSGCSFENNSAAISGTIFFDHGHYKSLFQNCIFANNNGDSSGAIYYRDPASTDSLTIENCSFYRNRGAVASGIQYLGYNLSISKSIFSSGLTGQAVYCGIAPTTVDVHCSDVFGNAGGNWVGCIDSFANINGNFSADPLFCYPDTGNYYLQSGSPCAPWNNSCSLQIGALGVGCRNNPLTPLIFAPLNGACTDSLTVFSWLKNETNDPTDTISFAIQIDNDSTFASPEINQAGLRSGMIVDDAFAIRLGELQGFSNLQIDTRYFWRVRSDDNYGLSSDWTAGTNWFVFMPQNHAPNAPDSGFSPANGEEVISLTPVITWNDANDPDGNSDSLRYAIRLSLDSLFSGFVYYDTTNPGINQIQPSADLNDNAHYFYQVKTLDNGGLSSSWSAIQNFWTNHYNFPPEPFPIYSPDDSVKQVVYYTHFSWGNTVDYDPNSSFSFKLQCSLDSTFAGFTRSWAGLNDTSLSIATDTLALLGQHLFWRIVAVDDDTLSRIGGVPNPEVRHITILPPGDANSSGTTNGLDVTFLVNYFKGGQAPDPLLAGDANGSCSTNGLDVTYLVNFFKGIGTAPVRGDCAGVIILSK